MVQPTDVLATQVTLGQKLGAAAIAVNALLLLVERTFFAEQLPTSGLPLGMMAVFDLAVAGAILAGRRDVVGLAIVRLVLGALVGGAFQYNEIGLVGLVSQLSLSVGALLLLVGDAKWLRLSLGGLLLTCVLSLGVFGLYLLKTGSPLQGAFASMLRMDLEGEALEDFRDDAAGWRMDWPGPEWRPRKEVFYGNGQTPVNRWLVQPRYDAHLLVMTEPLAAPLPPENFEASLLAVERFATTHFESISTRFEVLDAQSLGPGRKLLHASAEVKSQEFEYLIGLIVTEGMVIQVHGVAPEANFQELRAEMQRSIESLTVP